MIKRLLKVYYVDNSLLLVKHQQINKVLKAFNEFGKSLKFTADKIENETPHFLDLETHLNGLTNFGKLFIFNSLLRCNPLP